jgi:hypothetical protein
MIDCFVSCFRIKPHNNEALKVCLNPTSSFLYHYVLISSLYRYGIFTEFSYTCISYLRLFLCGQYKCVYFIYNVIFIAIMYGHFEAYTVLMFRKIWHESNFMQVRIEYTYCRVCVCACACVRVWERGGEGREGVQLKSMFQHSWTWLATAWLISHLCYHPVIFFCHLLIMLLLLQDTFVMCFIKMSSFFLLL